MIKRIGRYDIQAEIGRGGFGIVYKAVDPSMGRPVAIKELTAKGDKDILQRFHNEANAAGNLHHPNLVTIYEFGEDNGAPFIAMEFLEGEDLQHIIASQRPISLLDKVRIMSQVAAGLGCAHRSGVVHRDVKPANIMVLKDGTVKVMDFGIALLTRLSGRRLTETGKIIGTFLYMSPEHFKNQEVGALSDIFSYGVIFYEFLTGRHPFQSEDPRVAMYRITAEDPDPIFQYLPSVPEGLWEVVAKTLAKERELRYQSLDEVVLDLKPILMDLQRERSVSLLGEVPDLMRAERLEEATRVVREALELDPANSEARRVRDEIERRRKEQQIQPKIEALLREGEEHLAARHFDEAIMNFEGAVRLNPSSSTLRARVDQAKALRDQCRKAAALVREAERDLQSLNLTMAYRHAVEAARLDPENADATTMLRRVQGQVEEQERKRRVMEGLTQISGLVAASAFEDALRELERLDRALPGSAELAERRDRLLVEKADFERRERLRRDIAAARDLIQKEKFAEALAYLDKRRPEYAREDSFEQLIAYAQTRVAAQQRTEEVARTIGEAKGYAARREFDHALAALESAIARHPSDSSLITQIQSITLAKVEYERAMAVRDAVLEGRRLRREGAIDRALEFAREAVANYPDEPELRELRDELEKETGARKAQAAVRKTIDDARALLREGGAQRASLMLRRAAQQYGDSPELKAALEEAAQAEREQQRRESVQRQLALAVELEDRKDYSGALRILDAARRNYPGTRDLDTAAERVRGRFEESERQAIDQKRRDIEAALAARDPRRAVSLLESADRAWPGQAIFAGLLEQTQKLQKELELDNLVAEAGARLQAGDLDQAGKLLLKAFRLNAYDTRVADLQRELDSQRAARNALATAEGYLRQKNFDEAEREVRNGLSRRPEDAALRALGERIAAERAAERQRQADLSARKEVERLIAARKYEEALEALRPLEERNPRDRDLENLHGQAVEGQLQRFQAIAETIQRIEQAIAAKQYRQAQWLLEEAERNYPGQSTYPELRKRINEGLAFQTEEEKFEREVRGSLEKGDLNRTQQFISSWKTFDPRNEKLTAYEQQVERERVARDALGRSRAKLAEKRYDEAEALVREALAAKPGWPEAGDFLLTIDADREQERRRRIAEESFRRALEAARRAFDLQRFDEAADSAREALRHQPGSLEAQTLLETVEEARERERRRREEEQRHQEQAAEETARAILAQARKRLGEERFDDAEARCRDALALKPGWTEAAELQASIPAARKRTEEQRRRADQERRAQSKREVQQLIAAREFERALATLDTLERELPGDPSWPPLRKEAAAGKKKLDSARAKEGTHRAAFLERTAETKPLPPVEPPKPFPARAVGIGAALVAVAGIAVYALWPGGKTTLTAEPAALAFVHESGAPAPAPREVRVSSSGRGGTFASRVSAQWIQARASSNDLPGVLSVGADPLNLGSGTHSGTVSVESGGSVIDIPVKLEVHEKKAPPPPPPPPPPGSIALEPRSLAFRVNEGDAASRTQTVALKYDGSAQFESSASVPWLSVSPARGSAPARLTVTVQPGRLGAGQHAGRIDFTGSGAAGRDVLTVELRIDPKTTPPPPLQQPVLSVSPADLRFSTLEGADPAPQQVRASVSTGPLQCRIESDAGWINAASADGCNTINVAVAARGQRPGSYTGRVRVSSASAANNPQLVAVTLDVKAKGPAPPPACRPEKGSYFGDSEMDLRWSGNLDPGAKVYLSYADTGGSVKSGGLPGKAIDAGRSSATIKASPRCGGLELEIENVSGQPVNSFTVHWKLKGQ